MSAEAPLYITEADVVGLIDIGEAIAALQAASKAEVGGAAKNMVKTQAVWVAAGAGRPRNADVTLLKAMGMGICDLPLGMEIYHRAGARSVGRPLALTARAKPRPRSGIMATIGG